MNEDYNRAPVERTVRPNDVEKRKYCGYEMPHPQCDDACMYACTEGGKFPPKCNDPGV